MSTGVQGDLAYFEGLKAKIRNGLLESTDQREFLPVDVLDEIFTRQEIDEAVQTLRNVAVEHKLDLAKSINDGGKKMFAMLVYNGQQQHILEFSRRFFLDNKLPFSEHDAIQMFGPEFPDSQRFVREFQWPFCPHVFPASKQNYKLNKKIILPFLHCEKVGRGSSGVVEKVVIPASHLEFSKEVTGTVEVVRKHTEDVRGREYRCLRLLSELKHPNIIPLLASYKRDKSQYYLFKYFDRDLRKFLEDHTRHKKFQQDTTFYSALTGLASALSATHHFFLNKENNGVEFEAIGYHHDLRPCNVLVSHDSFILADFGEGNIKPAQDPSHTQYRDILGSYIAPECTDRNENPQIINRAVDVWAFGCLIAEVITYMQKGAQGVKDFRKERLLPGRLPRFTDDGFYCVDGTVKPKIVEWLEAMKLGYSQNDLIPKLIDLSFDALNPDPSQRPSMDSMHQRLAVLSLRKYLDSTEKMFSETCKDSISSGTSDSSQGYLASTRCARDRFNKWRDVFQQNETTLLSDPIELSEEAVRVLNSLLQVLKEKREDGKSGIRKDQAGNPCSTLQQVRKLWKLFPEETPQVQSILSEYQKADGNLLGTFDTPVRHLVLDFEKVARKFKADLTASVSIDGINKANSNDAVYAIVEKIQQEQQKNNGRRNLAKTQPYLERLEGYADIIQHYVACESSDIPVLLWGPITLLLQQTVGSNEAFDSLVDASAMVGEVLPHFPALDAVFQQSTQAKELLPLYIAGITLFYTEALQSLK